MKKFLLFILAFSFLGLTFAQNTGFNDSKLVESLWTKISNGKTFAKINCNNSQSFKVAIVNGVKLNLGRNSKQRTAAIKISIATKIDEYIQNLNCKNLASSLSTKTKSITNTLNSIDSKVVSYSQMSQTQKSNVVKMVFGDVDLKEGDISPYVIAIQASLAEAGYLQGDENGVFGKNTKNAILNLQKAKRLPRTGIADLATKKIILGLYVMTDYDKYAVAEIKKYIQDNKVREYMAGKNFSVVRDSTEGKLIPSNGIFFVENAVNPFLDPSNPLVNRPGGNCSIIITYVGDDPVVSIAYHKGRLRGWHVEDVYEM